MQPKHKFLSKDTYLRIALSCFRIKMLFTALANAINRDVNHKEKSKQIFFVCQNLDFTICSVHKRLMPHIEF